MANNIKTALKNYRNISFFTIMLAVILTTGKCTSDPGPLQDFLIKVDSIHLPSAMNANIPFEIEFYGTVGFDGCHSFKTFNQLYDNNEITVEAWGTFDSKAGACPTVMVYLNGQKLRMTIPNPGTYKLKIKNPDYYIVNQIVVN
jgi:hypothetical protein